MQVTSVHITQEKRNDSLDLLDETRDRLIDAIAGLTGQQAHAKPAPGRWSIAEILEHVVLLEMAFHSRVIPALRTGPAPERDAETGDAMVRTRVPDRETKYQVPGPLAPTGRWNETECLRRFVDIRQRTIEFASNPAGFREHTVDHPFLGPLDSYQWVLMVALHSARHTAQILEVRQAIV